jgi:preprotein translocase subunit SecG
VEILLYIVHVVVCFVLIMVVLLQSGKAADLAGAFGGGGSQTALGSRGAATVLTKATTIAAILFMLTSLGLALYGSRRGGSVLESVPVNLPEAPAAPAGSAPGAAGDKAPADGGAAPAAATPAPAAPAPAEAHKTPEKGQ